MKTIKIVNNISCNMLCTVVTCTINRCNTEGGTISIITNVSHPWICHTKCNDICKEPCPLSTVLTLLYYSSSAIEQFLNTIRTSKFSSNIITISLILFDTIWILYNILQHEDSLEKNTTPSIYQYQEYIINVLLNRYSIFFWSVLKYRTANVIILMNYKIYLSGGVLFI